MAEWWLNQLEERLSQGDIVEDAAVVLLVSPVEALKKVTIKGAGVSWQGASTWPPDSNGQNHFLARGKRSAAVIVSHSCDLDKEQRSGRVLLAPAASAQTLNSETYENVFSQRRRSMMPLPAVPLLGDCYANLRLITTVDRKYVDTLKRVASMTKEARMRFQDQLMGFLVRPEDRQN